MGISLGEIDGRDKGSSILSAGSGYPSTTKKSDVVQLYRLMLIDEETGLPRRAASLSEAQLIAQTLYRDAANSSLPCLRTASTGTPESDSDSDSGSLRSACQVAKHSGCDHCGTSVVIFANRNAPYPHQPWFLHTGYANHTSEDNTCTCAERLTGTTLHVPILAAQICSKM